MVPTQERRSSDRKDEDRVRVKGYSHSTLILTLIAESTMNKGIQANYEGMRVKTTKTFFRITLFVSYQQNLSCLYSAHPEKLPVCHSI